MKSPSTVLVAVLSFFLLTGFFGPDGDDPKEQRKSVQAMKHETLEKLYGYHAEAKQRVESSVGYAVFSNTGINLFLLSTGRGWGLAHNNETGKDTYMNMFSAGGGLGMGIKDFRGVFIFFTKEAYENFIEHGWQASAQADAAAKAGDEGGAADSAIEVAPGIELYQLTENGLALQATIQGTKYWKDDDLN